MGGSRYVATPDLAASDRILAVANESEQTGTCHQQEAAYLFINMATNINKTVPRAKWNIKNNNTSAASCKTNHNRADKGKARAETGGVGRNR